MTRRFGRMSALFLIVVMLMSGMGISGAAQSEPDPNATVDIAGLSLSCDGIVSFSTVVNVSYERFEGHFFVDIYRGEPHPDNTNWVTVTPQNNALLPGTTAYSVDGSWAAPQLEDGYVQVRWFLTVWDGPSALDYVGEWRGAEVAPMDSGCGEPNPVDEIVQIIIRVILDILARQGA